MSAELSPENTSMAPKASEGPPPQPVNSGASDVTEESLTHTDAMARVKQELAQIIKVRRC